MALRSMASKVVESLRRKGRLIRKGKNMKRDDTLMKAILQALEDHDGEYMSANRIRETLAGDNAAKQEAVTHHIRLLDDRGLVSLMEHGRVRLTWEGHEALKPRSSFFD